MAKKPDLKPLGRSSDPIDHPNHPDDHRAAAAPLGTDAEAGVPPEPRPVERRGTGRNPPPKRKTYGPE
jgi:hypothetical protein